MQGGQGRQGVPGMQRGPKESTDMRGQMGQQDRQRMRVHATEKQQAQNRTCTQSMERVRTRVREIARATKGQPLNRQEMQRLHQQLRSELRTMQSEREELLSGLDDEQKAAVQNRVQEMNHLQMDLDSFSEALGFELDQLEPNPGRLREQARNLERTAKQLQQEQRDMSAEAGLQ
jgi:hypothetical protein